MTRAEILAKSRDLRLTPLPAGMGRPSKLNEG